MWSEKTANGKVKFVERYKDPLTDKMERVSVTMEKNTASTRKQATAILNERIEELINAPQSGLTLEDIANDWFKVHKQNVKQSTAQRTANNIKVLTNKFGNVKFEKLAANMINNYYLELLTNDRYKYSSVVLANNTLKQVIKFALKYKGIDQHVLLDLLEVPKINRSEKNKLKYLEPDELNQIIDYFKSEDNEEYARMAIIQSGTGMRFSEMVALNFDDVNLEEHTIVVSKNYDHDHKIFTAPKNGDDRVVFFNDDVKKALTEQIQHAKLKMLETNKNREQRLLFVGNTGYPIRPAQMNVSLKGIISKPVSTHYFRHTFISLAVQNGVSKEIIAEQVGHADTKMIDKVYAHFTKKMRAQQKNAMLNLNIAK